MIISGKHPITKVFFYLILCAANFGVLSYIKINNLFDIGLTEKGILIYSCLSTLGTYVYVIILNKRNMKKASNKSNRD